MRFLNLFDLAFIAPKGLPPQNIPGDDFEPYTDGAQLNGLNLGWGGDNVYVINWSTSYAARRGFLGVQAYDTFESYSDGANVAGLNNGSGFSAAYVVH